MKFRHKLLQVMHHKLNPYIGQLRQQGWRCGVESKMIVTQQKMPYLIMHVGLLQSLCEQRKAAM